MPDLKEHTSDSILSALLQAQQTIALQAQTIERLTALLGSDEDQDAPDAGTSGYLNSRG